MKIALASAEFKNNDLRFNISQIEKALKDLAGRADLVCFGEAFLQGFDALVWRYEKDLQTALSLDSSEIRRLAELSGKAGADLLFGYVEKDGSDIYSSCAVIQNGKIVCNYRRMSKGWKDRSKADDHYKEGSSPVRFDYHGHTITLALCGDLWDQPEDFRTDDLLIWPVFIDYTKQEWESFAKDEYAAQAAKAAPCVLMINSICSGSYGHGGSAYFYHGQTAKCFEMDQEGYLILEFADG